MKAEDSCFPASVSITFCPMPIKIYIFLNVRMLTIRSSTPAQPSGLDGAKATHLISQVHHDLAGLPITRRRILTNFQVEIPRNEPKDKTRARIVSVFVIYSSKFKKYSNFTPMLCSTIFDVVILSQG